DFSRWRRGRDPWDGNSYGAGESPHGGETQFYATDAALQNLLAPAPARVLGSARGRVRPSCAPSIRPRTYGVRPPPQRDAPMSITDASRIADAALPQSESYWDNPEVDSNRLASPGDLDLDPVDPGQVERSPLMSLLPRSGATEIDGSRSNPADRSLGQTPDGKTIQVDTLHRDGDVQI